MNKVKAGEKITDMSVMVVGDLILDTYWQGSCSRLSPEAPVPVFDYTDHYDVPGGAGNVVANLSALGMRSRLIGLLGTDDAGSKFENLLHNEFVDLDVVRLEEFRTINKIRIGENGHHIVRVDKEQMPSPSCEALIRQQALSTLRNCSSVLVSDYGKGCLSAGLTKEIIKEARNCGKRVFVDPKGGDFERYAGAFLMTPNLSEFEYIVGPVESDLDLIEKAKQLREGLRLEWLLVTLGAKGVLLVGQDCVEIIPAVARTAFDVSGAGDTVIAAVCAEVTSGVDVIEAIKFANQAAGVVVGKAGTSTVTREEVLRAAGSKIIARENLAKVLHSSQIRSRKVVMTNGCFDVLHRGHVKLLESAKSLGDILVVALNDDDSVRELKGKDRPVNRLPDRQEVLASLQCVDYVTSFTELTPQKLYDEFVPNILVKGGDYSTTEVVGADRVLSQGGIVKVLDFLEGYSTTNTLEKMSSCGDSESVI